MRNSLINQWNQGSPVSVINSFKSLESIIELIGNLNSQPQPHIQILMGIGNEERLKMQLTNQDPVSLIEQYWLKHGFSIHLMKQILRGIKMIEDKRLTFYYYIGLNARISLNSKSAFIGSSELSDQGLQNQKEANIRFEKYEKDYASIEKIVRNYFKESQQYEITKKVQLLLNNLIAIKPWKITIALAIKEIRGEWVDQNSEVLSWLKDSSLWPIQIQSIKEALSILEEQGSVLIANPTGSGKTRTIAALHKVFNLIQKQNGNLHKDFPVAIIPPSIDSDWEKEFIRLKSSVTRISDSKIGRIRDKDYPKFQGIVKEADLLLIDEAHRFLNAGSNRSLSLISSKASNIILATATPFNKEVKDLFRMVELLDIDNLSDEAIKEFIRLKKLGNQIQDQDLLKFRGYLSSLMVRQTKKSINRHIEKDSQKYVDDYGRKCKYPKCNSLTYRVKSTQKDREIAKRILDHSIQLKGLIYLRKFKLSQWEKRKGITEEGCIQRRIKLAPALAKYLLRSSLRSSTAALMEHIVGTKETTAFYNFRVDHTPTKDEATLLRKLDSYKSVLPTNKLSIALPAWLRDPVLYQKACLDEISIYQRILQLLKQITPSRELSKINFLKKLLVVDQQTIAFDHCPITLYFLNSLLDDDSGEIKSLVVTGGSKQDKKVKAKTWFELNSKLNNRIGLFSDAMSESVNLQQASSMVFLDVPTVTRIPEQRIGRIDRLNSPHSEINIYWPIDSEEFSVTNDEKLIERHRKGKALIGANFDFPDEYSSEELNVDEVIREFEEGYRKEEEWEGLISAFQPALDLIESLEIDIEDQSRDLPKNYKTCVSFVESTQSWGFFCIREKQNSPAKWLLLRPNLPPMTNLSEIAGFLSTNLKKGLDIENVETLNVSERQLLDQVKSDQIHLLSNKKKRAIELLKDSLKEYAKNQKLSDDYKSISRTLKKHLEPSSSMGLETDLSLVANEWLAIIEPLLIEKRVQKNRKQVIYLNSLKKQLKDNPVTLEELTGLLDNLKFLPSIHRRIKTAIFGLSTLQISSKQ